MGAERAQVHSPESMEALCRSMKAIAEEYGERFVGFGREMLHALCGMPFEEWVQTCRNWGPTYTGK